MNIQLFFEDKEVELSPNISFPLNKTFENILNPTDIIVEYSKTVKIPASAANNRLMANAYRLDRKFSIDEDSPNIGLYLDPLRRIPMKLVYNGSIMLEGYAKYQSATINNKEKYYTFNLYGAIGDVFQSLMDCVVDENKLTDEQKSEPDLGAKYIIKSPWEAYLINKEFVAKSWEVDKPSLGYYAQPYDAIGMAPAYRGLYDDFESSTIKVSQLEVGDPNLPTKISVEDKFKRNWKTNLISDNGFTEALAQERVDAIDFSSILPNGLSEHNIRQFRAYEQKPYIYIHALLDLYIKKAKELTGYNIKLDPNWFNGNNPYYTNLCYMFDYLSVKGNTLQQSLGFTTESEEKFLSQYCNATSSHTITDSNIISKGDIIIDPFQLQLKVMETPPSAMANPKDAVINMDTHSCITVDIEVVSGGVTNHYYFWGGTGTPSYTANVGPSTGNNTKWPKDDYIYMKERTLFDVNQNKLIWTGYLDIPRFKISHTAGDDLKITYKLQYITGTVSGDRYKWKIKRYLTNDGDEAGPTGIPKSLSISDDGWSQVVDSDNFKFIIPNITYNANWRTNTTCELKNLYSKDEPLFNVILQYTKMMHLLWKADYNDKTISIMTPSTYFKDYKIVDWSDRIDMGKGMEISPVSFQSKYVKYNYEDVDGYRYNGYKNKYGVNYGEKVLRTNYNFDNNTKDLFKTKIYPSSISCTSFPLINDISSWNTISDLPSTLSEINFIDCENNEQSSSIAINNWYFRLPNKDTTGYYRIADVSPIELEEDKYYWIDNVVLDGNRLTVTVQNLPQFSPVIKSSANDSYYGCLFNCPNEDYTRDYQISKALGRYIYDINWSKYIDERYNPNNNKVVCYVKLSPYEFEEFNFKTFVTIDNQLFMVNDIIDYDINENTTKCELIRVTDLEGYIADDIDFKPYMFSTDEIYITPTYNSDGDYYTGSSSIVIFGYPVVVDYDDWDYVITPITTSSGSDCYAEGGDILHNEQGYAYDMPIYWDGRELVAEEYELKMIINGEVKIIPIHILPN